MALAVENRTLYYGQDNGVYRLFDGQVVPLTDWGIFIDLAAYRPPSADSPQEWDHPRFKTLVGKLSLVAFLLGAALWIRSVRWRLTGSQHAWRIGPLRLSAAGCAMLGALYLTQQLGWVSTAANEILWTPVFAVCGVMILLHTIGIIRYEWRLRQDAFWIGVALSLSAAGAWLWWIQGALVPALLTCAVGGLFFGRSLKGLRRGTWKRFQLIWGMVVLLLQLGALLPPLVFAAVKWGTAAFGMMPTAPLFDFSKAEKLTQPPRKFTWSQDGLSAAYVRMAGPASAVALVDASVSDWSPKYLPVPTAEVSPRFAPDSKALVFCYPSRGKTLVAMYSVEGARLWQKQLPGTPAPGWQPCWFNDGTSMIVLTYGRTGTHVWKLNRTGGGAVKLLTASQRLAWPSLAPDDGSLACAIAGEGPPGLASVSLSTRRVAPVYPKMHQTGALLTRVTGRTFDPSATPEGKTIVAFMKNTRDKTRRALAQVRERIHGVFGFFGWQAQVPELWIKRKKRTPRKTSPTFRWEDYDVVRDVLLSRDGKSLVCVAHRADGTDQLLHMLEGGGHCRVLRSTRGHLFDVRWAPFKNRLLVVEETYSALAPFPVRRLLLVSGLPEDAYSETSPKLKAVVPFTHWVASPQFSPDGQRVVYVAPDKFWRPSLTPSENFGLFVVALEPEKLGGVLGEDLPPAFAEEEK